MYLTQTTLSIEDAELIISALKKAFPTIHAPPSDDICYATTNRQIAVREDATSADLVLVVGSGNSSNSLRLTEIAQAAGTQAFLLDDINHLQAAWLDGVNSVLITAGASAPEHLVLEIVDHLVEHHNGKLEDETHIDEGMSFSMPLSVSSFLKSRDITVEGHSK